MMSVEKVEGDENLRKVQSDEIVDLYMPTPRRNNDASELSENYSFVDGDGYAGSNE